MLTTDMKRMIAEQRLGFVATTDADGSPNLSPKGTMFVIDDQRIGFADIRSPRTSGNVKRDGRIEINFVDPFARKGYRFKGIASCRMPEDPEFKPLLTTFTAIWSSLVPRIKALIEIAVERALPITTPPYDTGTTEDELRAYWTQHFRSIQPNGDFVSPAPGWKA
jgi:uncharacterized protein